MTICNLSNEWFFRKKCVLSTYVLNMYFLKSIVAIAERNLDFLLDIMFHTSKLLTKTRNLDCEGMYCSSATLNPFFLQSLVLC